MHKNTNDRRLGFECREAQLATKPFCPPPALKNCERYSCAAPQVAARRMICMSRRCICRVWRPTVAAAPGAARLLCRHAGPALAPHFRPSGVCCHAASHSSYSASVQPHAL